MLNKKSILKFNKYILKRYEANLKDGVLYLYNVDNEDIWIGNSSSKDLIDEIDGIKTLDEIYQKMYLIFEGYDKSEVENSINAILEELIKRGILEYS